MFSRQSLRMVLGCTINFVLALSICELLLIALTELNIISEQDARDLLTDVAAPHTNAALAAQAPEKHRAVVRIVPRILAGKDGVRH